jgi:hypothetical protein
MGWEADVVQRQYDMARTSIPGARSGGMDPIIGGALISGGAGVASSVAGGKAAKEAAKAQERAQREALGFAREQEATRKGQYDQAFKMWYASQQALRERYGLPALPPMDAFPASGGTASAEPRMAMAKPGMAVAPRPAMASEMPAGATIGDIIQRDPRAELEGWNDWSRMGPA